MKGPRNNADSDIGEFLHDLEEQSHSDNSFKPTSPPKVNAAADLVILSEFLKRRANKQKMSKRAIAISAYEAQKALCRS